MSSGLSRKEVLLAGLASLSATRFAVAGATPQNQAPEPKLDDITLDDLKAIQKFLGLDFSDAELKEALSDIKSARTSYQTLRKSAPPFTADPMTVQTPLGAKPRPGRVQASPDRVTLKRPAKDAGLAFLTVSELGHLLRTKQITSTELTKFALARLTEHGGTLRCVITLTEERALRMAAQADAEIAQGKWRGPLHGIPYGLKDLFSTKGYPTTFGAGPYAKQVIDQDAAVVQKLDEAGAVLVAKLSMGALAMNDVWFKGRTNNPWNLKQGSSGSSAGSAAAVAAGLVPFAIGTETFGSITSPSLRCRVTGFRPTFGRVSRFGGMELSYSLDKVGPICRSVTDCALVFAALTGRDDRDAATITAPFNYPVTLSKLRIAFLGTQSEMEKDPAARAFQSLGATVVPLTLTDVPDAVYIILDVECASAFDAFTREGTVRDLKNSEWPKIFRAARFVPAVDYVQAQRARTLAMQKFEAEIAGFDALLADGLGPAIAHSNFGGHPQIMLPWGDDGKGNSRGRSLVGHLYEDDRLLAIARSLQDQFDFHRRHPAPFV